MLFITLVTLLKASQYMLRYVFTPTGAITDDELTQTKMIADAAAGPLKTKLQGVPAAAAVQWQGLLDDADISVYISPAAKAFGPPALVGSAFTQSAGANVLELAAAGAGGVYVEIRFNHSIER